MVRIHAAVVAAIGAGLLALGLVGGILIGWSAAPHLSPTPKASVKITTVELIYSYRDLSSDASQGCPTKRISTILDPSGQLMAFRDVEATSLSGYCTYELVEPLFPVGYDFHIDVANTDNVGHVEVSYYQRWANLHGNYHITFNNK
jgi:hypothetical protein